MSLSCGKLSASIVGADCNNPLIPGIKPTAYLINHEDIDIENTKIVNGVITNLALKTYTITTTENGQNVTKQVPAMAYKVETLNDSIDANLAFAKGAYYNGWDHNFVFRIFDNTPGVKQFVNNVSKSKLIAIIENNYIKYKEDPDKKGNTVYEAYGFYTGLQLNEATRDSKDADTKGGYVLTCGCSDNAKEPALPLTVFLEDKDHNASFSETKRALEAMTSTEYYE